MGKAVKYEKRLTLFIDFLGFSEIVKETVSDPKKLVDLVSALKDAAEVASLGDSADFMMTQFSDCIVISYRADRPAALFQLVNKLSLIVVSIAGRGYLLRGGLTFGDLLHTDEVVVGPALIRAHELESKIASVPRVIIDPSAFNVAMMNPSYHHEPSEELEYIRSFLKEDDDGYWFFDYFSWGTVVGVTGLENHSYPQYLTTLSKLIKRGLKKSSSKVLEKYIWMHKLYNSAREPFVELPADHFSRKKYPGYADTIADLPSMDQAATKAAKAIAKAL